MDGLQENKYISERIIDIAKEELRVNTSQLKDSDALEYLTRRKIHNFEKAIVTNDLSLLRNQEQFVTLYRIWMTFYITDIVWKIVLLSKVFQ